MEKKIAAIKFDKKDQSFFIEANGDFIEGGFDSRADAYEWAIGLGYEVSDYDN